MALRTARRSRRKQPRLQPAPVPGLPEDTDLHEHHSPELERQLLRSCVHRMAAGRASCSACGRSPLVGERLLIVGSSRGERTVCELCLPYKPSDASVDVVRVERIPAGERRLTVERAA
jgi:hypothetical protein